VLGVAASALDCPTVPVKANQQATLTQGETTLLFRGRFGKVRLTLTGVSGEFTTIPFQTQTRGGAVVSDFFEASEVELSPLQSFPSGRILATAPEGVATLDIVYEVRTRRAA
jgi:hypothetical protein